MRVPLYRIRTAKFEVMFFDGSPAGALEIIEWGRAVAPYIVIRERIEYGGWTDREGHLKLEIQGNDLQATAGDWIVCVECGSNRRLEVETGDSFKRRFEPV